jgi:uncharacterized protein
MLSADLIRPDVDGEYPAIVEYHPYRKDDNSRSSLNWHHYFAQRGFVGVRLDVRGSGGSDGFSTDEYVPQEQEDGYDAIEWLAGQTWCNGNIGMFGASYGGFTAIQVAMLQPPHLKAIVPLYATDDRYTDDCHYSQGGNMRMYYDVGVYGGFMVALNALPPHPELAGSRWAEAWKERLEKSEPYLLKWIKQQVDGPYWRHGSLRPNYTRLKCPVFLIGGWHDGYANPMLRMFTHFQCPKKLLMGPWVHTRPHASIPGPQIDFFHEVLRFFAHWLNNQDTGIMSEPAVTTYVQEYAKPERTLDIVPGRWRNDVDFPPFGNKEVIFYLGEEGRLSLEPHLNSHRDHDEYEYRPAVGVCNAYWSGGGISYYLAEDQRLDEAHSCVYTTPPFNEEMEILGWPKLILHASSSARVVTFVAKLADVAPDGSSALIVDGSLNGTRRHSFTDPSPMKPGEIYELNIPIQPTGWVIQPGHRLRLAICSSDFPNLWPTPERAVNRIYRTEVYRSRLVLPVVVQSQLAPPRFLPPPRLHQVVHLVPGPETQQIIYDQITNTMAVDRNSRVTVLLDDQLGKFSSEQHFHCSTSCSNPAHASIIGLHRYQLEREDGVFETSAESTIRASETAFHVMINLNVTCNGKPFFQKQWLASESRQLL